MSLRSKSGLDEEEDRYGDEKKNVSNMAAHDGSS